MTSLLHLSSSRILVPEQNPSTLVLRHWAEAHTRFYDQVKTKVVCVCLKEKKMGGKDDISCTYTMVVNLVQSDCFIWISWPSGYYSYTRLVTASSECSSNLTAMVYYALDEKTYIFMFSSYPQWQIHDASVAPPGIIMQPHSLCAHNFWLCILHWYIDWRMLQTKW